MASLDEDVTPSVLPSQVQEISLRAHWLDSLSADDRERLPDLPLGLVEQMFVEWRRRTRSGA